MVKLEETWRWFGPADPIPLEHIRQAGATGIVTALHHLPNGVVWSREAIAQRQQEIAAAGLRWSVVESVPVHEDLKKRQGNWRQYLENYQQTLRNLHAQGITTICYNFMPVLDWTRTDLAFRLPSGALALRFDLSWLALFDCFILQRPQAEDDYPVAVVQAAATMHQTLPATARDNLTKTILAGLPGAEEGYTLQDFRAQLAAYHAIDAAALRENLLDFLRAIAPLAQELDLRLAIHPDDPPFPLFRLPRVVSTLPDFEAIIQAFDDPANGICFCTGSLAARADNDLPAMAQALASRINFLHLRSITREANGSFYEANHLEGHSEIPQVMALVVAEQFRRLAAGRPDYNLPMRPDHGHQMLDDLHKTTNPGYSAIGRLRGLAELRGLEKGIHLAYPAL